VIRNPVTWTGIIVLNWLLGTRVRFRFSERLRFRGARPQGDDVDLGDTVLTMNRRNREFVDRYNPAALLATLDKARVKGLLAPIGIPMARTFLLARGRRDLAAAAAVLEREPRVAIKPASASGGEGIVLVRGRSAKGFHVNGHVETRDALLRHIRRILDGDFNDGMSDTAILEELLETDPVLAPLAHEGVPDLRIVCFLGYPVMAMARLPTRQSAGRANLHSGAVGAGISLSTGRITSATWGGISVDVHPDTGVLLKGFKIPRWREILEIASGMDAAVIGPGLGASDATKDAIRVLVRSLNLPMVLDADALTAAGEDLKCLSGKRGIVTPHHKEFEVLSGTTLPADLPAKIQAVKAFAMKIGFTVLLKGAPDVITDGTSHRLNKVHNVGMTKGGTGDSLAGICGALLSKRVAPFIAARMAAFANGYAGNLAFEEKSYGMMTTDLIEKIPRALKDFVPQG